MEISSSDTVTDEEMLANVNETKCVNMIQDRK